ncbi:MAG: sensor histidine kinase [Gaiellaceae bacterium]
MRQAVVVRVRLSTRSADAVLALAVAALSLVEIGSEHLGPYAASVPLSLLQAGALAWRRRASLPALLAAVTALFVETAAGVSLHTPLSPIVVGLIVVYSVAQYEPLPRALAGLAAALAGIFASIQLAVANGESYAGTDRAFVAFLLVAPWLVGRALHGRTREAAEHAQRAERLERERQVAVEQERARIARELHDVIAHSLSVMVVQAGAAEQVVKRSPERALEPLRWIQDTGRQALFEMGTLLGMLREGHEELGLAPQHGIADLQTLLEQTQQAGLPTELVVEGTPRPLPPGLDLSAYRIVQEALTNTRKHAGDARAHVHLRYRPDALEIEVHDDGAGSGNGTGGGHGLIGLRERVAVFGGEVEIGPLPSGGFAVRATLPLQAASA